MSEQFFAESIREALDSLDQQAQNGKFDLVVAEAAKAIVFSLLSLHHQLTRLTRELNTLNARLDGLTGDVQGGRKVLRVYDWAKHK